MRRKIYTRGGDRGCTDLGNGARVRKDSAQCEACGALDEANALVGACLAETRQPLLARVLGFAAHRLYNCAGHVAAAGSQGTSPVSPDDVAYLEAVIDEMSDQLPLLGGFVIPTGVPLAARLHVARTVVRRAERRLVTVSGDAPVSPVLLQFINRLSDALFVAARYANHLAGERDALWDRKMPPPGAPSGEAGE